MEKTRLRGEEKGSDSQTTYIRQASCRIPLTNCGIDQFRSSIGEGYSKLTEQGLFRKRKVCCNTSKRSILNFKIDQFRIPGGISSIFEERLGGKTMKLLVAALLTCKLDLVYIGNPRFLTVISQKNYGSKMNSPFNRITILLNKFYLINL
jgi:hypothetical protein